MKNNQNSFVVLTIIQQPKNGILSSTYSTDFDFENFHINIQQAGIRQTIIYSNKEKIDNYFSLFNTLDRLTQIFDGKFIPIKQISITDENQNPIQLFESNIKNFIDTRLSYFESQDIFLGSHSKLAEPLLYINDKLLIKWQKIQQELDIIHQGILYFTSDIHLPIDIRLAHIIETMEPLSEYVGLKGATLKDCIDKIISQYGRDVFRKELNKNKDEFLKMCKHSRVRIMHSKPNCNDKYIKGPVVLMYIAKFTLMYRKILMKQLGIKCKDYKSQLNKEIKNYNHHLKLINNFVRTQL